MRRPGQQAFYRLELARNAPQVPDNPDQRIQEDVNVLTEMTLVLAFGAESALLTLCLFTGMLWVSRRARTSRCPCALGTAALDIPASWSGLRCCTAAWAPGSPSSLAGRSASSTSTSSA